MSRRYRPSMAIGLTSVDGWDPDATLATFHEGRAIQTYGGRGLQKCKEDLDRYERILNDTKPELVIEVGTRYGGSAIWFADKGECEVISIDNDPSQRKFDEEPGITFLIGNSTDPAMVSEVWRQRKDRRTMVLLDGDHHAPQVWNEIQAYGPMTTPGCVFTVEDGCFDFWDGEDARRGGRSIPEYGGVFKAIDLAALDRDPRYKRRTDIESMFPVSHNPAGYWERVR